jgi:hypothetical protein
MAPERGGFLRNNAFLLAAVSLPLIVVVFFIVATAIPRWRVPPPQYDLILRANGPYTAANARLSVDFAVRDGRVEARFRLLPENGYASPSTLFLFDHTSMSAREIPLDVPGDLKEGDPPRTVVVEALAGRRVVADTRAPDGYQLEIRSQRGPGLVGELFGMNRYGAGASLVNRGRVIAINLPIPYEYQSPATAVGWIVDSAQ